MRAHGCPKIFGRLRCFFCPNVPSLASIDHVEYEIELKSALSMRISGPDLPGAKHFGVSDSSCQVNAQWPQPFSGCGMGCFCVFGLRHGERPACTTYSDPSGSGQRSGLVI